METDAVVTSGGAAGLGVAWDLTLRGLRVTLVEMRDVATGTSGRYHGRLHGILSLRDERTQERQGLLAGAHDDPMLSPIRASGP